MSDFKPEPRFARRDTNRCPVCDHVLRYQVPHHQLPTGNYDTTGCFHCWCAAAVQLLRMLKLPLSNFLRHTQPRYVIGVDPGGNDRTVVTYIHGVDRERDYIYWPMSEVRLRSHHHTAVRRRVDDNEDS